jgi:hypothetical protein
LLSQELSYMAHESVRSFVAFSPSILICVMDVVKGILLSLARWSWSRDWNIP